MGASRCLTPTRGRCSERRVKLAVFAVVLPFALLSLACSGGQKEPAAPEAPEAEPAPAAPAASDAASEEESAGPVSIPTTCHDGDSPCTADPKWVKRLCQDVYPAVALYLNSPASPFTRGYLTRKTKAVNASGGATSGDEWLKFDEQVVLLYHRKSAMGGMQVSGAEGGFDAIRWDGSCVTLDGTEVRTDKPPEPLQANIDWRYLGEDVQDALKAVPSVRDAYVARKQECKGAYSGDVSKECEKKDLALRKVIVKAVQSGEAKLPVPARRP